MTIYIYLATEDHRKYNLCVKFLYGHLYLLSNMESLTVVTFSKVFLLSSIFTKQQELTDNCYIFD